MRSWPEISADLLAAAVGCDEDIRHILMREAAVAGDALAAEVARLMVIATDTQLENEITRALNHIPARCLRDGEPWEEGVRRMREELDEWRSLDPQQRVEQERHNRSVVEAELSALTVVVAAVHTAIDAFDKDRPWTSVRAHVCLSAIAEAVGR